MTRLLKSALILGILIGLGTATYAALIGVNGLNRRPRTRHNSGNVAFDATTGILLLSATPVDTTFASGGTRPHAAAPPSTLQIQMQILDVFGNTYQGLPPTSFLMEGSLDVDNNGTIEAGETGVMLTGDLVEFGFNNSPPNTGSDSVDFRFKVTGGYLAPFYAGQNIGAFGVLVQPNNWPTPPGNFHHFAQSFDSPLINGGQVMPIECGTQIGDFVWHDVNSNGIQDAGETGINGVTVNLRDTGGALVATTTTGVGPLNQNGYYQFKTTAGFCAGTWTVEVDTATLPPGMVPTTANAPGSNNANDSSANPATVVLATDISKDQTTDFGFRTACDSRIGSFVWHDLNRDGIQDPGEPGLDGVGVTLYDSGGAVVGVTTTNGGGGHYEFTGVCEGDYTVVVTSGVPAGFLPTTSMAGGSTSDNDSNGSPAMVMTRAGDPPNLSVDFGYMTPCDSVIGDFLWYDVNQNGLQDAGEPGIDGVTVNLLDDASGAVLQTTASGSNGAYQFTGVCGGTYRVEVDESTLPPGRTPTIPNAGAADVDSDTNPSVVAIGDSQTDSTIDFGFIAPCTGQIGDFVWHDENGNGIQDAGEAGFAGATVNLRKASDNSVIQTEVTGADGAYMFEALCPGSYIVEAVPPAGTTASPVLQGGDPAKDSNPNLYPVTLPADNSADLTVDFGFFCSGELGDFVWDDLDRDGVQDAGEPGLPGVTVTLSDPHGHTFTTNSGANGAYSFGGLCAGAYTVEVATPAGYVPTAPHEGGNTAIDSNSSPAAVNLHDNNSTDLTIDFGFMRPCTASIGDFVWNDANANGVQDAGEPGIEDIVVHLLDDGTGTVLASATTDASGFYQFDELCAGTFRVVVEASTLPANFVPTASNQGGDPAKDSNGSPAVVTLAGAETNPTIDFGYQFVPPPPAPNPEIKIVKSANRHLVVFGQSVTYTYKVTNTGNVTLTDVVVVDDNATPRYKKDDFTAGTVASLAAGASVTFTATRVPPAKMCNDDPWGTPRKCGMMIVEHLGAFTKFTYLQAKDHRDDHHDDNGWWGGRAYSSRGKFRIADKFDMSSQDVDGEVEDLIDNEEFANAITVTTAKSFVSHDDDSVNVPRIFHKSGWDDDWKKDWDARGGDIWRWRRWDDDKWDHDNDRDYDYWKHPKICVTTSTNIAWVTATYDGQIVKAADKETVVIVAPPRTAAYKTFTQGGWGAKPNGDNPGKFLAENFSKVYSNGFVVIGGSKTIKLTSANAIDKFLPQGGAPAKLTQNYINPTWQISVLAGQVLALRLNVDFSAKEITKKGFGNLVVVSGKLKGKTVNEVLALGNSALGGGSLPWNLSIPDLNEIIARINENFEGGTHNNGYLN